MSLIKKSFFIDRLLFIPVGLVLAIVARPYNLTYLGFAIMAGVALFILDCFRDADSLELPAGKWFLITGVVCLAVALFICNNYGITFDALDQDKAFPKLVRRLPYFGIALITMGTLIMFKSVIKTKER